MTDYEEIHKHILPHVKICDSLNLKIIFFRFEIDPETSLVVVENKLQLVASNNSSY